MKHTHQFFCDARRFCSEIVEVTVEVDDLANAPRELPEGWTLVRLDGLTWELCPTHSQELLACVRKRYPYPSRAR